MKSYATIKKEAAEYDITVVEIGGYISFERDRHQPLAIMTKVGGAQPYWYGYAATQTTNEVKRGRKADVADWCLDTAINGH